MNAGKITVSIPSETSTAQCDMDQDKTVFVCTETTNGESILSVYTKKASTSYSQGDLTGLWKFNTLISPTPWWGRTPLVIQPDGSVSGTMTGSDPGETEILVGTFTMGSDGIVTASAPTMNSDFRCAMDSGKTILSCTGTGLGGDSNLMVGVKQPQGILTGLAVTGGASSVNEGGGSTYAATAYWSDGTGRSVTPVWSVTPNTYASINSSTGALTTLAVPCDQTVSVTATYSSGGITLIADRKVTIVDLQDTLNVSINGTGAGSVHSVSPVNAISCNYPPLSGTCSTTQANGTSVELAASPSGDSAFSGWSGACTNSVGNCTVDLDADKTVTAIFAGAPLAMIGTTPYDTLQAAYNAAALSGSIIMLKEGDPGSALGTLNANDNKSVTIQGGYNADYKARSGSTIVTGPVNLGSGSVTFDGVGVK